MTKGFSQNAKLFVVSGASGTGKTTLCHAVVDKLGMFFSVSATTRKPRGGEVAGRDYYFLSRDEFEEKIAQDEFLEWAQVHENYYGTLRKPIEESLKSGQSVLLDLDTQGALQLKEKINNVVLIFIKAPRITDLQRRLHQRGTEAPENIEKRMAQARLEIEKSKYYDFIIINKSLEHAKRQLLETILAQLKE